MEFRDNIFENLHTLSETSVWIIFGNSALLTNYAIDKIKEHELNKSQLVKSLSAVPTDLLSTPITDMETDTDETDMGLAKCELSEVWKRPGKSIAGRWLCIASYENMLKKDRANLANYIKNPCKNVLLIVTVGEFRSILEFKKNSALRVSNNCHTVNMSYPSRRLMLKITRDLFKSQNVLLTEEQLDTFIMKMGRSYEEYRNCIDKAIFNLKAITGNEFNEPTEVQPLDFKDATKDIEQFEVNDLLVLMLTPMKGGKPLNGRRSVHKALARLLEKNDSKKLCNQLRYRIKDLIVYRIAVNNGLIPVKLPYNTAKIQEQLPETELYDPIRKASAYAFKRNAYVSSLTSLQDWYFMYSMLENVTQDSTEQQGLKVLLNIVNRTALSNDRLMNNIGIKNTLDEGLVPINSILYTNWWQSLKQLEE